MRQWDLFVCVFYISNSSSFSIIVFKIQSGNYSMIKLLSWGELDLYIISYTQFKYTSHKPPNEIFSGSNILYEDIII